MLFLPLLIVPQVLLIAVVLNHLRTPVYCEWLGRQGSDSLHEAPGTLPAHEPGLKVRYQTHRRLSPDD